MPNKSALPPLKMFGQNNSFWQRYEAFAQCIEDCFAQSSRPIQILEAGCGRQWHLQLQDVPFELTGLDVSGEALKIRREKFNDLDRMIVGDLCTAEIPDASFDVVYCVNVLEHIEQANVAIANFVRWLRPGGLLLLGFPDRDSVFGFITRLLPFRAHIAWYRYVLGKKDAGRPGHGPFPTFYSNDISRTSIHDYCRQAGHTILLERGTPYDFHNLKTLRPVLQLGFKLLEMLSLGSLAAKHGPLTYVIQTAGQSRVSSLSNHGHAERPAAVSSNPTYLTVQ